jgi:YD repeat-containing protein
VRQGCNAAGNPIATMVDSYDPVGNRTGRNQDGVVTTWSYDNDYRLTGQQTSGGYATFQYDPAGNILVKWQEGSAPMSMAFDAANRITTIQQGADRTTMLYDATGNQIEENLNGSRTTNQYDNENRLIGVQFPTGSPSTYSYDGGDGLRRTLQEAGGPLTTVIWDGTDYLKEKS